MSFPQLETDISFVDFLASQPCLMISHCAWLSRCISILPPENTTMSSASILILDGESLWNHHCSPLSHSFSWLNPYFSCLKTPFIILKSPFFLEHVKTMLKPLNSPRCSPWWPPTFGARRPRPDALRAETGFSGSGTPGAEYGAEASRAVWRVALDFLLFPGAPVDPTMAWGKPLNLGDAKILPGWL